MSRYIDLDKLLERWNNMSVRGRTEFDQEIMVAPTIDIVRCGECKCCRDELIEEYMPLYIYCEKWNHETDFDSFCSTGERIDNE